VTIGGKKRRCITGIHARVQEQSLPGICPISGALPAHSWHAASFPPDQFVTFPAFSRSSHWHAPCHTHWRRYVTHHDSRRWQGMQARTRGQARGPWVAETEKAWRGSLRPDQKIELDLRQLTGVDDAGRDLLAAIHLAGACFIVEGVWLTALIGELNSEQRCGTSVLQPSGKKLRPKPSFTKLESSK